ncbi:MAG: VWA domain-containing protein, partial [Thermoanaerobaculia bacterium]
VKLKIHQDFTQDRYAITESIHNAVHRKDPEKHIGRHGRVVPPSGTPSLLRQLPQGKELRKKTTRVYDGIRLIAEATGYVVGRKNLMLFSIGFGEFRINSPIPEPDRRYYPQMVAALNDHNVAVYPIDMMPQGFEHAQSHFLARLANETGGRYYENFVNFIVPLRQISKENAGYYLLSYQAEHPATDSGFQEVKVRARDKSIKVRARKGYRFGLERDS